jgi:hypothetical protein
MDSRRLRTILGIVVGVLLVAGFGLGRVLGGVTGDGPVSTCDDPLSWDAASGFLGEHAAVAGPVAAVSHEPGVGGAPTFVNLGNAHPDADRFDVVIYDTVRQRFEQPPEALEGADVCVRGQVRDRDGVPQIVLDAPSLLSER